MARSGGFKGAHVCGAKGLRPVGFGWKRPSAGVRWARYMVRKCLDCRTLHITGVSWVMDGYRVCPSCLGQAVKVDLLAGEETCMACGTRVLGGIE